MKKKHFACITKILYILRKSYKIFIFNNFLSCCLYGLSIYYLNTRKLSLLPPRPTTYFNFNIYIN